MNSGRQIGIFGLFGGGNIGNEATLAATVRGLRQLDPGCELILVSPPLDPESGLPSFRMTWPHDPVPVSFWLEGFRPARFRGAVRTLLEAVTQPLRRHLLRRRCRRLDLFVVAGTGIADDFGQEPYQVPLHLMYWCQAATAVGVPVRFVSIGAGPVANPLSCSRFGAALLQADFRSYRDAASRDFAGSLGVDIAGDAVEPDLVFSLRSLAELRVKPVNWPPRELALGIMAYTGWNALPQDAHRSYESYLARVETLARQLLARGYRVRLVVGNRLRDVRPLATLAERLSDASVAGSGAGISFATRHRYLDVLQDIAACDLLVATRFHNLVFGLLLGRPCISLGYGRKNDDLMRTFGLGEYCHAAADFEPAAVLTQIDAMAAMPEPQVGVIMAQLALAERGLAQQFDHVLTFAK